jgi:hypothetical protein
MNTNSSLALSPQVSKSPSPTLPAPSAKNSEPERPASPTTKPDLVTKDMVEKYYASAGYGLTIVVGDDLDGDPNFFGVNMASKGKGTGAYYKVSKKTGDVFGIDNNPIYNILEIMNEIKPTMAKPAITPSQEPNQMVVPSKITRQEADLSEIAYVDSEPFSLDKRLLDLLRDPKGYGDEVYRAGIAMDQGTFIVSGRYKGNIAAAIHIGSKMDEVVRSFGEPSFKKKDLIYYKTKSFYLAFSGKEAVEEAILTLTPHKGLHPDILMQLNRVLNARRDVSLQNELQKNAEWDVFFEEQGFINPGGWYARSDLGIEVRDFYEDSSINVTNDYTGDLYQSRTSGNKYAIHFENVDSIGEKMFWSVSGYHRLNDLYDREGKLSPSGKQVSVYEWIYSMLQYFTVRSVDASTPDFRIPLMAEGYEWLTDHYILYIDFIDHKPMIVSVEPINVNTINLLEKAGITDKDSEYSIDEIKNGVIKLKRQSSGKKDTTILSIKFQEGDDKGLHFEVGK